MHIKKLTLLLFLLLPPSWSIGLIAQNIPANRAVPANFQCYRDLHYVSNGSAQQSLDLYLPKTGGSFPLIIWIHGGGWQGGSKEQCLPLRTPIAQEGYAIASINYRLTGEAIFPAQIEDCKSAIRWLRANAAKYQIDPKKFAVWGSSAGGHLVALVGTCGDSKIFDKGENLDQSSEVQAVCDFYGPTDLAKFVETPGFERHALADSPESKLLGGAVLQNIPQASAANPISYISPNDPPFLIVHGDKDPVVSYNQSELLHDALLKAGLSSRLRLIPNAKHGGPEFVSTDTISLVSDFLGKNLKSP